MTTKAISAPRKTIPMSVQFEKNGLVKAKTPDQAIAEQTIRYFETGKGMFLDVKV